MPTYPLDEQIPTVVDPATGLPIGPRLANPNAARAPQRVVLEGRYCRLEPLHPDRHGDDLYAASTVSDANARFMYLPADPPKTRAEFQDWMVNRSASTDPLYFAVIDRATGRAVGRQSLMRIDAPNQVIEIGDIYWGPAMSRTALATEAQFLFAKYAFDELGYRRYEWKCNALNAPSRRAAERFGFVYEGHFRRAVIVKGCTRDTSWYSMIDEEWSGIRRAYERWLDSANFDASGGQRVKLETFLREARNHQHG